MEWYPRYPSLWRAKTMHLTPYQDGCYLRLIDHYMETRQPLPANDAALARIIGVSLDEWHGHASGIVRAFFRHQDGLLFHDRCDQILRDQDERAKKHTEKSKKGAAARWNKTNGIDAMGMPQAMPADATGQDRTRHDSIYNRGGGKHGRQKPTGGDEGRRIADKILADAGMGSGG
ncbi:MAG: YdaU family protein [Acidobacteriaceae bacterium]